MAAFLTGKDMSFRTLALRLVEADERLLDAMHGSDYARLMSSMGEYLAGVR